MFNGLISNNILIIFGIWCSLVFFIERKKISPLGKVWKKKKVGMVWFLHCSKWKGNLIVFGMWKIHRWVLYYFSVKAKLKFVLYIDKRHTETDRFLRKEELWWSPEPSFWYDNQLWLLSLNFYKITKLVIIVAKCFPLGIYMMHVNKT